MIGFGYNYQLWLKHIPNQLEELCNLDNETLEHISNHDVNLVGDNGGNGSGKHAKFRNNMSDNENLILVGYTVRPATALTFVALNLILHYF